MNRYFIYIGGFAMRLVARNLTNQFRAKGLGDQYGPELVVGVFDEKTGNFHGGLVGDNSSLCARFGEPRAWNGGIRKIANPQWRQDIPFMPLYLLWRNLARPMTVKHYWCFPTDEELSFSRAGGGKAMWILGRYHNHREEFIREWAQCLSCFRFTLAGEKRYLLGDAFIGGADAGTNEFDMALICNELGDPRCVTGGPGFIQYESLGTTGMVLLHAAKVLTQSAGLDWDENLSIALCGFGQVGQGVAKWLLRSEYSGPRIIAVSDKRTRRGESIRNAQGIDLIRLLKSVDARNGVLSLLEGWDATRARLGSEISAVADILILAAPVEPTIGTAQEARRVRAKIVLSGTNNGISDEAYGQLHERGIIAPLDATVNIGAASVAWASRHGLSDAACIDLAIRAIETNLERLIRKAGHSTARIDRLALEEVYRVLEPVKTSGIATLSRT